VEVVTDLIGRAAIAVWNMKKLIHIAEAEIGYAPSPNLSPCTQTFEFHHNTEEVGVPVSPVQQVEIELIAAKTREACFARARDAVSRRMFGQYLGDEEYAIAVTSNQMTDEFLGAAVAVQLRCVNHCHPQRNTSAQRFFLDRFRTPSLPEPH